MPLSADLSISDAGSGGSILRFGAAAGATDGYDPSHDVLAPPPPPGGFDARFRFAGESFLYDFRATGAVETIWAVYFQAGLDGGQISVSWDPADFPATGDMLLRDAFGGTVVNIDMRTQTAFTVPNGLSNLQIVYKTTAQRTVDIAVGWNLVGLPLLPETSHYLTVFPNAMSNTLFRFAGGYATGNSMVVGEGYWLRFNGAHAASVAGTSVNENTFNLEPGWNLISGLSCSVQWSTIDDPGAVVMSNTLFGFNLAYALSDVLQPGKGYWVRANANGDVDITCNAQAGGKQEPIASISGLLKRLNRLDFSDSFGAATSLYFGPDSPDASDLVLPPAPPETAFDVRFDDGRFGATWPSEDDRFVETIRLQAARNPVVIEAALHEDGWSYTLEAVRDGRVVESVVLKSGEGFPASPAGSDYLRIVGRKSDELPARLMLEQNFPNPFNPVTHLRYDIPEASDVRLTVFNALGQQISTLVDERRPAGRYTAEFDGGRVPSGVYYVILEAGGERRIRRMVLVK